MAGTKIDCPDYTFTEDGQIYSHISKKFLRQCDDKDGYKICAIKQKNGQRVTKRVHRIIASTYIDNPDCKPIVNHKDGNKANNHISNLEWVTAKENRRHAIHTGLFDDKAESNPNSKLKNVDVWRIRNLYGTGLIKQAELAAVFGVSQVEIGNIVRKDNWRTI